MTVPTWEKCQAHRKSECCYLGDDRSIIEYELDAQPHSLVVWARFTFAPVAVPRKKDQS